MAQFTLSYEQAMHAAFDEGKRVQADFFGSGWSIGCSGKDNAFWQINPHTGTHLLHDTGDERCNSAMWRIIELYEYAGFKYVVDVAAETLEPLESQHPAANKQKHRMAALECWKEDRK